MRDTAELFSSQTHRYIRRLAVSMHISDQNLHWGMFNDVVRFFDLPALPKVTEREGDGEHVVAETVKVPAESSIYEREDVTVTHYAWHRSPHPTVSVYGLVVPALRSQINSPLRRVSPGEYIVFPDVTTLHAMEGYELAAGVTVRGISNFIRSARYARRVDETGQVVEVRPAELAQPPRLQMPEVTTIKPDSEFL